LRYYEVLLREAELVTSQEDFKLVNAVRERIAIKVAQGESPRFDLIRADAESKTADMRVKAAEFRLQQARALLQQAVGFALPNDFLLTGRLQDIPPLADELNVRAQMLDVNPEIQRAKAEIGRAERALEFEKARRLPTLALRGVVDEDPDMRVSRLGVVMTIPIWDQRRGPIGETAAQLSKARNDLEAQTFSLSQGLAAAFDQYRIASTQVNALESGILREAEAALRAAESAYKFGERGFLEVLDAQRVFRAARAELVTTRFQLASAWVEIQRLRASSEGSNQ
jgi:cobalt-zinc-cadmium efflux system outer membrane protein